MASSPRSPGSRALLCLLWILQLVVIISHIGFITYWIGSIVLKGHDGVLTYIYALLLLTTILLLSLILTEIILQLRSALPIALYHTFQLLKIRIGLIEMIALGILCHNVPDMTWLLVLTACAGIPFNLSFGFAVLIVRREEREVESKERVDEESPLLGERRTGAS